MLQLRENMVGPPVWLNRFLQKDIEVMEMALNMVAIVLACRIA
ncbi:MAG: hypothetical protein WCS65_06705 [Verrucomicrobiae bacterium]